MKTRALKNYGSSVGIEVYDIDLDDESECIELGKLTADQCIVLLDKKIDTKKLYQIQSKWGKDSRPIINDAILAGKLTGKHWTTLALSMGYITREIDKEMNGAVLHVTYLQDERGKPKGLFAQGELDWHSDQVSYDDAQRMIALQSVSDTENSQTQFLCTHDAYESLSSDMKSMVKELYVKHKWRESMTPGLSPDQMQLVKYNYVPKDGVESRFYSETVTGRPGLKLTIHSFDGFVGMSKEESDKIMKEITNIALQDKYVYTQDWQDGQIVFMDQEITIHKRPTNIQHGNRRKMARCITYLNYLFPDKPIGNTIKLNGHDLSHDEFIKLVDEDRKRQYAEGGY